MALPVFCLYLVGASPALAQHSPHIVPVGPAGTARAPVTIRTGIGKAHDAVTTKSAEAQAFYDQGLAYLDSYVWIEAARSFHQALRIDPGLALAQVGPERGLHRTEQARPMRARRSSGANAGQGGDRVRSRASSHRGARAADGGGGRARRRGEAGGVSQGARLARSRHFRRTRNSCCCAASRSHRIRPIADKDRCAASIPYYERALKVSPTHFGRAPFHGARLREHRPDDRGAEPTPTAYATPAPQRAARGPHARPRTAARRPHHRSDRANSRRPTNSSATTSPARRFAPAFDWHIGTTWICSRPRISTSAR